MSKYSNAIPIPNKLYNEDGTITTMQGEVPVNPSKRWANATAIVNKTLEPDGTEGTLNFGSGGGGGGTVDAYTKAQTNALLANKSDKTDTYNKTEVDTSLSTKESVVTAGLASQYYRGDKTWRVLSKAVVGLANVDNTSDLAKPISTATQNALDDKANITDLLAVDEQLDNLEAQSTAKWVILNEVDNRSRANATNKVDKVDGFGLSQQNYTLDEKTKLASIEDSKFKGQFISFDQLELVAGTVGDYAYVDEGVGNSVVLYSWDTTDSKWIKQVGESTAETPVTVKAKYESNPDTNAFTNTLKEKLESTLIFTDVLKNSYDGAVEHLDNLNNPHIVTKAQIGLSNVDNTADVNKNVLTATKLATPRKINGVLFDGTTDIETELVYRCTGVADDVAISNLVNTFLADNINNNLKLSIVGNLGFSNTPPFGDGTVTNPYCYFKINGIDGKFKKLYLDFSNCNMPDKTTSVSSYNALMCVFPVSSDVFINSLNCKYITSATINGYMFGIFAYVNISNPAGGDFYLANSNIEVVGNTTQNVYTIGCQSVQKISVENSTLTTSGTHRNTCCVLYNFEKGFIQAFNSRLNSARICVSNNFGEIRLNNCIILSRSDTNAYGVYAHSDAKSENAKTFIDNCNITAVGKASSGVTNNSNGVMFVNNSYIYTESTDSTMESTGIVQMLSGNTFVDNSTVLANGLGLTVSAIKMVATGKMSVANCSLTAVNSNASSLSTIRARAIWLSYAGAVAIPKMIVSNCTIRAYLNELNIDGLCHGVIVGEHVTYAKNNQIQLNNCIFDRLAKVGFYQKKDVQLGVSGSIPNFNIQSCIFHDTGITIADSEVAEYVSENGKYLGANTFGMVV